MSGLSKVKGWNYLFYLCWNAHCSHFYLELHYHQICIHFLASLLFASLTFPSLPICWNNVMIISSTFLVLNIIIKMSYSILTSLSFLSIHSRIQIRIQGILIGDWNFNVPPILASWDLVTKTSNIHDEKEAVNSVWIQVAHWRKILKEELYVWWILLHNFIHVYHLLNWFFQGGITVPLNFLHYKRNTK